MPAVTELAHAEALTARSLPSVMDCAFYPLAISPRQSNWSVYNPSLCRDPAGGYQCLLRYSSWPRAGTFPTQSHLFLARLDEHLEIQTVQQLDEPPRQNLSEPYVSFGPEDARLFRLQDQWFASATFCDAPECYINGHIQARIGLILLGTDFRWQRTVILPSRDGGMEKNWMPIEGEMAWLYDASQTICARQHEDAGKFVFDSPQSTLPELAAARGGTQLIEIEPNKLLGVIHETATDLPRKLSRMSGYCRAYTHRFVLYSRAPFQCLAVSPRFYFLTPESIEFAAGLTHVDGRVLISFGHHDRLAWIAEVRLFDVLRFLAFC